MFKKTLLCLFYVYASAASSAFANDAEKILASATGFLFLEGKNSHYTYSVVNFTGSAKVDKFEASVLHAADYNISVVKVLHKHKSMGNIMVKDGIIWTYSTNSSRSVNLTPVAGLVHWNNTLLGINDMVGRNYIKEDFTHEVESQNSLGAVIVSKPKDAAKYMYSAIKTHVDRDGKLVKRSFYNKDGSLYKTMEVVDTFEGLDQKFVKQLVFKDADGIAYTSVSVIKGKSNFTIKPNSKYIDADVVWRTR